MNLLSRRLTLLLLVAALGLALGGGWFYTAQRNYVRAQVEESLSAIARLKVEQIIGWRNEQAANAAVLTESPFMADSVAGWMDGSKVDDRNRKYLLTRFKSLKKRYLCEDVLLVDPSGTVRLGLDDNSGPLHAEAMRALQESLRTHQPALSDLHGGPGSLGSHSDTVAPFFAEDGTPVGAIILRIGADRFLYPLIQSWPTLTRSAEALLVRRDGDAVLLLNEPRHKKGAALSQRIPLTRTNVPAVMAVLGREGIVYGRDYRDIPVVADLKAVPDSTWCMVAKMDLSEAFAAWRFRSVSILVLLIGLFAGTGAAIGVIWTQRNRQHFRDVLTAEAARRVTEDRYRITLQSLGDSVVVTDAEGRVTMLNPAAESLTGWRQDEALGHPIEDVLRVIDPETREPAESSARHLLRSGHLDGRTNHLLLTSRNGRERAIAESATPIRDEKGGVSGVILVLRDLSAEHQRERERETMLTFLRLLNDKNHTRELIQSVTRYLQQWSGCEAVGVRLKEGEDYPYFETRGFPAQFVEAENYLCERDLDGQVARDSLGMPILECMCGNVLRGRFDASLPFFTHKGSFWSNCTTDLLASTTEADRQARTRNRCNGEGYESVALIRMQYGREALGLLQFNDRAKGRFTPELLVFLESLADQLAIALAQRKAQESLRQTQELYDSLFQNMLNGMSFCRILRENDAAVDFVYLRVNKAFEDLTGLKDVAGKKASEVIPGIRDSDPKLIETYGRVARSGQPEVFEMYVEALKTWFAVSAYCPAPEHFVAIFDVITERKQAEEDKQRQLERSDKDRLALLSILEDQKRTELALHGSMNRLGLALEASTAGMWEWDLQTNENVWSDELWAVYGLEPKSCKPSYDAWKQIVHPDDLPAAEKALRDAVQTGSAVNAEWRLAREERWLTSRGRPVRNAQGTIVRYVGIVFDITDRKRAEERVRETEERFRLLVDNMLDAALILNWAGDVLFANQAAIRLVEFDPGAPIKGLSVLTFAHPESLEAIRRDMKKVQTEGGRFLAEYRIRTRRGIEKWVEALGVRVRYEGADTELVTLRDITERKRMEEALWESQERYRMLFAEMLNGFALFQIIADEHNKPTDAVLLAVNPSFERLTGLRADAVLGKTAHDVLPPSFWVHTYEKILLTNQPVRFESYLQQFDRYLEVTAFCPKAGQCATIIGDITERKRAELAILKINEELEERVRLRTAELESTNRELDAFSYSVSHDLRAPLRAVGGFSRILVEGFSGNLPDQARHYLDLVASNARHMGQLVDDLLSFSRLSRQSLKTQNVNPDAIVREVLERLKPDTENRQIEFVVSPLPVCDGDPSLLRHVFTNLLSNAVKFTRKKPVAHIEIGAREEAEEYVFFIKDNGTGFDMQYADKLFGVFQRLHRAEDFEGTGVGLAIIQRIIHRHGGRVWAEAEPEKGATFYFSLKKGSAHES